MDMKTKQQHWLINYLTEQKVFWQMKQFMRIITQLQVKDFIQRTSPGQQQRTICYTKMLCQRQIHLLRQELRWNKKVIEQKCSEHVMQNLTIEISPLFSGLILIVKIYDIFKNSGRNSRQTCWWVVRKERTKFIFENIDNDYLFLIF